MTISTLQSMQVRTKIGSTYPVTYLDRHDSRIVSTAYTEAELAAFHAELTTPIHHCDPITGSDYRIYAFNQDRYNPHQGMAIFFHAIGSSPHTRQGYEAVRELRKRLPNQLLIAIGSEGTDDVRTSRQWHERANHATLAAVRHNCIEHVRSHLKMPQQTPLHFIGQSYGGIIAYETCRLAQEQVQLHVKQLSLLATPNRARRSINFLSRLITQEAIGFARNGLPQKISHLSSHATEVMPRGMRAAITHWSLIRIIAQSELDLDRIDPRTRVLMCAGEKDHIARTPRLETTPPNQQHFIVRGNYHSDMLLDAPFCAEVVASTNNL